MLLGETVLFTTKRVCKIQFLTRVCNHYPMLTMHIDGLRIYNIKTVIVKSCNIEGKEPRYRYLSSGIRLIICCRETLSILDVFFPTTPNLSTVTEDIRSPNTISSVTCSRRKVKFSSSLNGSPTTSG